MLSVKSPAILPAMNKKSFMSEEAIRALFYIGIVYGFIATILIMHFFYGLF